MNTTPSRYLKAFVFDSANVTFARAAFQFPKDAFEYVAAHDKRFPKTAGSWIIRNAAGQRITGTTAHGNAILDILEQHDQP